MHAPQRVLAIALSLGPTACDPSESPSEADPDETGHPREPLRLLDPEAWVEAESDHDPLPQHRPDPWICPLSAWGPEFGALEVTTQECNYLSVAQPLAHAIAVGDPLKVTAWWQTLIAAEAAEGHLALFVDGELLWEEWVQIPGDADVREVVFESPLAAPAGAEVIFHLHNHGYNSWTFAGLELLDPDGDY